MLGRSAERSVVPPLSGSASTALISEPLTQKPASTDPAQAPGSQILSSFPKTASSTSRKPETEADRAKYILEQQKVLASLVTNSTSTEGSAELRALTGTVLYGSVLDSSTPTKTPASTPSPLKSEKSTSDILTLDQVKKLPKGKRPDPSEYLSPAYIGEHLAPFIKTGASWLVPQDMLDKYGRDKLGWPDNSQFVKPTGDMLALVKAAKGDRSKIEQALGLPAGAWKGRKLAMITVGEPQKHGLRMAAGNEMGANEHWIPGGFLPDGSREAIVNQVEKGNYIETEIVTTEPDTPPRVTQ